MGTKTVDGTGAATRADEDTADGAEESARAAAEIEETGTGEAGTGEPKGAGEAGDDADAAGKPEAAGPSGVGQGAGAVVSAGLGVVSLTGGWVGTVASARESLIGQLETSSSSDVATMIEKGYGDAWHATALWGGLFALAALIVGVVVLVRPAFGAPGRPQAPWTKSVAWAGVALGVIGLLLAVLKYTDVLLGLPSTG
ncbi:hypothetical protein [Streptomyces sp. enrichment culture]|uniref:hypothetical protein n=1 Tax=Streptomyces sp. enrichment culture TaxID=1795815 RepID=UPI003F579B26